MKGKNRVCTKVRGLLGAFADNELTKRERTNVVVHLTRCTICTEELLGIRELAYLLLSTPVIVPTYDLVQKIEHAVSAAPKVRVGINEPIVSKPKFSIADMCCLRAQAYICAVAVFMLGLWTSWEMPTELISNELTKELKIVRTKSLLIPTDCYVATCRISQEHNVEKTPAVTGVASDLCDKDALPSLIEAMGLKTDEDGLYAVEM